MPDKKDPKLCVTVLKLVVGAIVFIFLVGLGLYYSAEFSTYAPPKSTPGPDWGIFTDSPVRSNR